ncbi:tetratricopeptide repeat protein [Dyella terrae]|uniref:tetratricopeptide repeat protein n=1 Tax=Dyella terrae TaxID=522259 RepID=UPI001EFC3CCD|nr:hypothetical protein [Dyella terrae]ULU25053.1 hypothetical protein DYST_01976 [Dyella terrae]
MLAGIGYLIFRSWALGTVTTNFQSISATPSDHLWEISTVYLRYVKIILWPVSGMGPIHPYIPQVFQGTPSPADLLVIAVAFVIVGSGLYFTLRHKSPTGAIIVGATAALLPVLHIIPVAFDKSLYHERYAALSLAIMCAMLPLMRRPAWLKRAKHGSVAKSLIVIVMFFWLTFSIIGIRTLLPNWTNDETLWRWALSSNPHDADAKFNLLSTYIRNKDYSAAHKLGDKVLADSSSCDECMLKIAELAIFQHEPTGAAIALERVRHSPSIAKNKDTLHTYYLLTGEMLAQQGSLEDAENILHAALSLAPQDAETINALNLVLSLRNRATQANQ